MDLTKRYVAKSDLLAFINQQYAIKAKRYACTGEMSFIYNLQQDERC